MTCRDVMDRVEAFAAGDQRPDDPGRAHIESCPRCASALADAMKIEHYLRTWPAPEAPSRFTAAVQHRVRRLRWQAEERVDQVFNTAMVLAALLVIAGIAGMFNVELVLAVAASTANALAFAGAAAVDKAALSLVTYTAAMGLVASALVMWWWTEGSVDG